MINKAYFVPVLLFLFGSCSQDGLTSVSGVEGSLNIQGAWPDSVYGISVLALDSDITSDPEHPADYLVSYGDPVMNGDTLLNYFIQLKRGAYYLAGVGLTVDPSFFITNLDSFLSEADDLPLAFLEMNEFGGIVLHPVIIQNDNITSVTNWTSIQFNQEP